MARWLRRPSRRGWFSLLMCGALICALAPPAWTRWLRTLLQPVALLQRPVTLGAQQVHDAIGERARGPLSAAEAELLRSQNDELRRLVGNQELLIAEQDQRLGELAGLREQFGNARVKLVIGQIIAYDTSPLRAHLRISEGSRTITGLRPGLWVVAAGRPPESPDRDHLLQAAQRQWIIGRLLEVQPFVSTVQLATDPGFGGVQVRPARIESDGSWSPLDLTCALKGAGGNRMIMDLVPRELVVDRTAVFMPASELLPIPVGIGKVTAAKRLAEAPQHFDYEVRPWGDWRELRFVYILIPA